MILRLASTAALMLVVAGPAFAVGPTCGDQIAALKGQLSDNANAKASFGGKVEQADRLCKQNKDEEAQNMLRQIREQMSQAGSTGASGSSTSSGTSR
ncbi:MAG TPA: hypothetical protein VJO12_03550 [Stellaceae bacterium]|nr:hypothetical protein [Stellaceae bacterium]